jgi:heterotetrameric sarcosine oxidase delta subunit
MSYTITCPVCGKRDLGEFRFGNEEESHRPDQDKLTHIEYINEAIMHTANAGPQKEWWCHASGCGSWFTIFRNTLTGREVDERGVEI